MEGGLNNPANICNQGEGTAVALPMALFLFHALYGYNLGVRMLNTVIVTSTLFMFHSFEQ